MLRRRLRDIVMEVFLGDQIVARLTRAERRRWDGRLTWQRFHASEDGKISFVSIFTVLTFIVIIVLVTNSGIAVSHKIQLQNAADATAYSSALWQARSLNAITTANHMMGELTALTVILDSFGGPMLGNTTYFSNFSNGWNDQISGLKGEYLGTSQRYGSAAKLYLGEIDKQVVDFVVELLTNDEGEHEAGAAIFDAKMTLKFIAFASLWIKDKANFVLFAAQACESTGIFAWVGVILEILGVATHVGMSGILVKAGVEWAWLEATETAIGAINQGGNLRSATEKVIRVMSLYADGVVGSTLAQSFGAAPYNESVRKTQEQMVSYYGLTAANTFPAWDEMRLPVVKEPPPVAEQSEESNKSLGSWSTPESEWSGNFTHPDLENISKAYETVTKEVDRLFGQFKPYLGAIAGAAGAISDGLNSLSSGLGGGGGVSNDVKQAIDIANKLAQLVRDLSGNLLPRPKPIGFEENPCYHVGREEYRLPKFYWQAERRSQWVRATYPYVDEYRAPIISFFRDKCELSDAATYYAHWSNRYTLANSFEIRRLDNASESSEDSEKKGLLEQLKKEVRELRRQFNEATDDTDEENNGNVTFGKFDAVSVNLLRVVSDLGARLRSKFPGLADWLARAKDHKKEVRGLRDSVEIAPDATIPEDTLRGLAEEMALINVLDELLNLLEEFLDALELKEPHMYILQGMHPHGKGVDEPWLTHDEQAEELFCITAYVSRPAPTVLGSVIFKHSNVDERFAIASALVYNANGRIMAENPGSTQPNTGWDTLNWEPPVRAAEWGDHKPSERSDVDWWQLMSPREVSQKNRVKLNWQVKLVPLTESRSRVLGRLESDLATFAEHHELFNH